MTDKLEALIYQALDSFNIELPSWGFANTGTRFGKFVQAAAANTVEEKFSDAGQVHALTGACPTIALHIQWDMPKGVSQVSDIQKLALKYGVQPGSINPNVFQDQEYKFGSLGNPDPAIRKRALDHMIDCVAIADALNCRDISPWFADGSNYPGTQSMRKRIGWFEESLKEVHSHLNPKQRLLIEYKPVRARLLSHRSRRLGHGISCWRVTPGRRPSSSSTPAITTRRRTSNRLSPGLLHHDMMGGFHFNDRRYADDDLTLGSIDPYQIFRIFHEIHTFEWEKGERSDIAYMVDQSHNLKGQDGSHDPDRLHRAGAVRESRAGRPRTTGKAAGRLLAGRSGRNSARRFLG